VGEESWVGKRGQAALSGSKPKAPGSAGGYLLISRHNRLTRHGGSLNGDVVVENGKPAETACLSLMLRRRV
jgi:hypothetical protein